MFHGILVEKPWLRPFFHASVLVPYSRWTQAILIFQSVYPVHIAFLTFLTFSGGPSSSLCGMYKFVSYTWVWLFCIIALIKRTSMSQLCFIWDFSKNFDSAQWVFAGATIGEHPPYFFGVWRQWYRFFIFFYFYSCQFSHCGYSPSLFVLMSIVNEKESQQNKRQEVCSYDNCLGACSQHKQWARLVNAVSIYGHGKKYCSLLCQFISMRCVDVH